VPRHVPILLQLEMSITIFIYASIMVLIIVPQTAIEYFLSYFWNDIIFSAINVDDILSVFLLLWRWFIFLFFFFIIFFYDCLLFIFNFNFNFFPIFIFFFTIVFFFTIFTFIIFLILITCNIVDFDTRLICI